LHTLKCTWDLGVREIRIKEDFQTVFRAGREAGTREENIADCLQLDRDPRRRKSCSDVLISFLFIGIMYIIFYILYYIYYIIILFRFVF
jgi:hypothetical protein